MEQVLAIEWALELQAVGHIVSDPSGDLLYVSIRSSFWQAVAGLGGVGFAPSNEDLAFRAGVCHLMNLFLRTMFKLRQGPVQFLGLFFGH